MPYLGEHDVSTCHYKDKKADFYVYVQCNSSAFSTGVKASTLRELYNVVDARVNKWNNSRIPCLSSSKQLTCSLYFGMKPLPRECDLHLSEYNIHSGDIIKMRTAFLRGGARRARGTGFDVGYNHVRDQCQVTLSPDYLMMVFEAVMLLIKRFSNAHYYGDLFDAVTSFVHAVKGKSMASVIKSVTNFVRGILEEIFHCVQSSDEEQTIFERIQEILSVKESLENNLLVKKLKKIFYYLLSFSILEPMGITFQSCDFSRAVAEAERNKHSNKAGFLLAVIDGFSYVAVRLYDVYQTGDWNVLLCSSKSYREWATKVYRVKEDSYKMVNPEAAGLSMHEYLGRITEALEEGACIEKHARKAKLIDSADFKIVQKLMSELRILQAKEQTRKAAQKSRPTPYSIKLYGGSSIGKSGLTDMIMTYIGNARGLPLGEEYKFTRVFDDEFWSGFESQCWFLVLDEMAAKRPDGNLVDRSMQEMQCIISPVAYNAPQADLDGKGCKPVKCDTVVSTTNVEDLHARAYYSSALAVMRRFDMHVEVVPKEEYSCIGTSNLRMLDPQKVSQAITPEGCFPNLWDFIIKRARAVDDAGKQSYELVVEREITDIDEFLNLVAVESQRKKDHETSVLNSLSSYKSIAICKQCMFRQEMCKCARVQSSDCGQKVFVLASLITAASGAFYMHQNWNGLHHRIARHMIRGQIRLAIGDARDTCEESLALIRVRANGACETFRDRFTYEREAVEERLSLFGETCSSFWSKHSKLIKTLAFLTTAVGGVILVKNMLPEKKKEEEGPRVQGTTDDVGTRIKAKDEKPNPWFKDDYEPAEFDIGKDTKSWKGMSQSQMQEIVAKNVIYMRIERIVDGQRIYRKGRAICLGGQLYATTEHNFQRDATEYAVNVVHTSVCQGISPNITFTLEESDIKRFPERDLAFFQIQNLPPKKDLTGLLATSSFQALCSGMYFVREESGNMKLLETRALAKNPSLWVRDFERSYPSWVGECAANTADGWCGAPLIGFTQVGPVLLGLHQTGGFSHEISAVQIDREIYDRACAEFRPVVQSSEPHIKDEKGEFITITPVHMKSVFRYIDEGQANVYGSVLGRVAHKSRVAKTFIRDAVVARGYKDTYGKPAMRGWEPWRIGAVDIVSQKFQMSSTILKECVQSFTKDILQAINPNDLSELVILEDLAVVNGLPGVKYIDKMNRKSSMGFPWSTKKRNCLKYLGQHDIWQDCVDFDDNFYNRVDDILARYKNGERVMPLFTGHLKDEPTTEAKILAKKTRVFAGAPADWSFVVRKYLLSFIRLAQKNRFALEAMPGTNATSIEWDDIYHHITKFGEDRMIAGDYSKFDKNMSPQIILGAFDVVIGILKAAGWAPEQLIVVQGIAYDVAFPLVNFNGDIVEFFGSNPSGQPLTVTINSIVNSLLLRYVWRVAGNDLSKFTENVAVATYGDDNIMGVHRSVTNFDHTVLVEKLAEVGVKYTMADKETESIPFIHVNETSFLKRRWRYEPELGSHVAPIEEASIAKMLTNFVPNKVLGPREHAVEVLDNAVHEYFFYGREIFEQKRKMCLEIIAECDLEPEYKHDFPTWEQLLSAYRANSDDRVCFECFSKYGPGDGVEA
jgi:hypothetical protein